MHNLHRIIFYEQFLFGISVIFFENVERCETKSFSQNIRSADSYSEWNS